MLRMQQEKKEVPAQDLDEAFMDIFEDEITDAAIKKLTSEKMIASIPWHTRYQFAGIRRYYKSDASESGASWLYTTPAFIAIELAEKNHNDQLLIAFLKSNAALVEMNWDVVLSKRDAVGYKGTVKWMDVFEKLMIEHPEKYCEWIEKFPAEVFIKAVKACSTNSAFKIYLCLVYEILYASNLKIKKDLFALLKTENENLYFAACFLFGRKACSKHTLHYLQCIPPENFYFSEAQKIIADYLVQLTTKDSKKIPEAIQTIAQSSQRQKAHHQIQWMLFGHLKAKFDKQESAHAISESLHAEIDNYLDTQKNYKDKDSLALCTQMLLFKVEHLFSMNEMSKELETLRSVRRGHEPRE